MTPPRSTACVRFQALPRRHRGIPVVDGQVVETRVTARTTTAPTLAALWPIQWLVRGGRCGVIDPLERELGAHGHAVFAEGVIEVNGGVVSARVTPLGAKKRVQAPQAV